MPVDDASREAVLQSSFRELSTNTKQLNEASDDLSAYLHTLDEAFTGLNIGVTGWVTVTTSSEEQNPYLFTEEQLGYSKVGQRKGLAVRIVKIDRSESGEDREEVKDLWLLNDAPRAMRLRAVDYIPELMQVLTKEAAQTAKRVREKADLAKQFTAAVIAMRKGSQR